jgi:hypothetical protein
MGTVGEGLRPMLVGIEDRLDDAAADLEGFQHMLAHVRERLQLVGIRAAATESSMTSMAFLDKSTATASEVSALVSLRRLV